MIRSGPQKVFVKLGKSTYPIYIQNGLLSNCGSFIRKATRINKIAILSSPLIYKTYGPKLLKSLRTLKVDIFPILFDDRESRKTKNTLFYILQSLSRHEFQRDSCLITLGGGVIGDLGGLSASLYMRGIDFIQCPTTLLAQVDASIGGKTAIDFYGIKNLIGAFHQPKVVFIDPEVLKTLNNRQFKTGLAELIKHGIILDGNLFGEIEEKIDFILQRKKKILLNLIFRSCKIKARIVSDDEREKGKRAWLNYGHTFGHALESYYHYNVLTHGEAITYGMWFAAMLSYRLGLCSQEVLRRQHDLFQRAGLFRNLPRFRPEGIYERMVLDKKARSGQVQFVLTRKIGLVTIQKNIPRPLILSTLKQLQAEASKR